MPAAKAVEFARKHFCACYIELFIFITTKNHECKDKLIGQWLSPNEWLSKKKFNHHYLTCKS